MKPKGGARMSDAPGLGLTSQPPRGSTSVAPSSAVARAQLDEAPMPPVTDRAVAGTPRWFPGWLQGALMGVQPGELPRTLVLTLYLFVASSVFVLGRTTRDAIFLSFYGPRAPVLLPYMFLAYGVVSALVAGLYARVADAVRRDRFVIGVTVAGAVTYAAARALLPLHLRWLPAVLYVSAEVVGNLALVQFWSMANDLHDARSARRLFGVIGLGRTLGVLACGLGASGVVHEIGTDNLLLVVVGLMAAMVGLVRVLVAEFGLAAAARPVRSEAPTTKPLRDPYTRALAAMLLLGFIAVNVGDFQFKAAARIAHPHSSVDLARFMALFYATMGAVALAVQLLVTPRLLRRFGVLGGALALPVGYLAANVLLLAWPSIQTATILKISDNALQFTVFDATLQLFYFPLQPGARDRVRGLLETAAKPMGYALAGALVIALRAWRPIVTLHDVAAQSAFVVPVVLAWLALVPRVHDRYMDALRRALARHEGDPFLVPAADASTRAVLVRALREGPARVRVYALDQLATLDPAAAREALPPLLEHPEPTVRAAALSAAGRLDARDLVQAVRDGVDDPDDGVAAAAIAACGTLEAEDCILVLAPLVHSRRRAVQDAALGAMLAHGGLEGVLAAGRVIEAWLHSHDPQDRRRAAELLAYPGIPGLSRIVRELLGDRDPSVRRAALAAAAGARDPRALPMVLAAAADPTHEKTAIRALASIGDAAVPAVARALSSLATPRAVRLALPRALQLIGSSGAYSALLDGTDDEDPWVRQKILAAASRIRGRQGFPGIDARRAAALMLREIDQHAAFWDAYVPLRARLAMPLVDAWMLDRFRKALVRVLRVAELSRTHAQASAARDQLFAPDPRRRAVAIEMCENLLDNDVRRRFTAMVDDLVALRGRPLPPTRPGRVPECAAFALALVHSPDPFARIVGLDVVQFRSPAVPFEQVFALLRDDTPGVREMAALALAVRHPGGWRAAIEALTTDSDRRVRAYAEYVTATGRSGLEDEEDGMYTTLEKLLYLQRIPLFAEVPPEHLLALARAASVERRAAGDRIFAEGDAGDALYFVIEGRVRVGSRGHAPAVFLADEVFGETSVLDSAPRAASAEVVDDATLLRIGQEDFYEVLHATTELAEGVIHVLVRRLRAATPGG